MFLSKKSVYEMRAMLEIAKDGTQSVITVSEIAKAQEIPKRFLAGHKTTAE